MNSKQTKNPDISINFCGVHFKHPFVLAPTPASHTASMVRRAFEHGWSGAIWKTLGAIDGVEDPKVSPCYAHQRMTYGRLSGFENIDLGNEIPLENSLSEIAEIKKDFPEEVLIVSIRGENNKEKWQKLAREVQLAGADMLEVMHSCPHDISQFSGGEKEVAEELSMITSWVSEVSKVPLVVKLSPNVTDIRMMARAAEAGGADGISATNTFRSIMGVDLDTFFPLPSVGSYSTWGGYSGPPIKPLVLRFISELAGDPDIKIPIAAIGGVETWKDAVEYILLGSTLVQVGTAVMFYGFRIVEDMIEGLQDYLIEKRIESVSKLIGYSLPYLTNQPWLSREYKVKAKIDLDNCVRCLRCYIACRDGGYEAIIVEANRTPVVLDEKCVGCSLCSHVCPIEDVITMKETDHKAED